MPQLPERRRPDLNRAAALAARDRVLQRMAAAGRLGDREAARAALEEVPGVRLALPALAAHTADLALKTAQPGASPRLTLKRSVQRGLEAVARNAATRLGPKLSVAMVMADSRTGDILGEVGSASYFDGGRSGWIDMTRVLRSPGSTLKPFIYGLAFEQGMVAQETLIEDSPADFSGYRPKNFDMGYQGDVSIARRCNCRSTCGHPRARRRPSGAMTARFRGGVSPALPLKPGAGLANCLGGVASPSDLVQPIADANGGRIER